MRDVVTVDLEEATQVGTRVRTTEPIRAKHAVGHRDEGADLVGEQAHVIRCGNRRALAAFQQWGDVRLALFGFRVQAVPTFGVEAVAAQFVKAGAGPDVGGDAEVLVQQLGCGNGLTQDGATAQPATKFLT